MRFLNMIGLVIEAQLLETTIMKKLSTIQS